jgi:hypothetical protein
MSENHQALDVLISRLESFMVQGVSYLIEESVFLGLGGLVS